MEAPAKPRKGREFLIGFGSSFLFAAVVCAGALVSESFELLLIGAAVLLGAALLCFIFQRPMVGAGVLTMLLASPLLLIGSCFALGSFTGM